MRLAVVGSVSLAGNADAERVIEEWLDAKAPSEVISGGAKGIDSMAANAARRRGIPVVEYLPEYQRWEPYGYKERNLLIAANCDELLRIASKVSKTYGSGWTRDRAKEMGKPCHEVLL